MRTESRLPCAAAAQRRRQFARAVMLGSLLALPVACDAPPPPPPLSEADLWSVTPRAVRSLQQGLAAQDLVADQLLRFEDAGWRSGLPYLFWPELFVDGSGRLLCDSGTAVLTVNERGDAGAWMRQVSLRAEDCKIEVAEEWPSDSWDDTSALIRHSETVRIDGAYVATATWPTEMLDGLPSVLQIDADFRQEYAWTEMLGDEVEESAVYRVTVTDLVVRTTGQWPGSKVVWNGAVLLESLDEASELQHVEWRFDDWTRAYEGTAGADRPTHVRLGGRFRAAGGANGDRGCLTADLDARTLAPLDTVGLSERRYCFREGGLDVGAFDMTFIDGDKVIGHSGTAAVDLDCRSVRASWTEACFSPRW